MLTNTLAPCINAPRLSHRTPSALFYPPLVLSLAAVLAAALLCPSNAPAQRQASSRHVAAIFGIQTLPGLGEQEQSQTNGNGAREDEVDKKGGPLGDESLEEEMHLWQAEVEGESALCPQPAFLNRS